MIILSKSIRTMIKDLAETVESIDKVNGLEQAAAELDQKILANRKTIAEQEKQISAASAEIQEAKRTALAAIENGKMQGTEARERMLRSAQTEAEQIIASKTSAAAIENLLAEREKKAEDLERRAASAKQAADSYQKTTEEWAHRLTILQHEHKALTEKVEKIKAEIARIVGS